MVADLFQRVERTILQHQEAHAVVEGHEAEAGERRCPGHAPPPHGLLRGGIVIARESLSLCAGDASLDVPARVVHVAAVVKRVGWVSE